MRLVNLVFPWLSPAGLTRDQKKWGLDVAYSAPFFVSKPILCVVTSFNQ